MNSLSEYQQAVLAELGIPLWRLRQALPSQEAEPQAAAAVEETVKSEPEVTQEAVEPEALVECEHPMAMDVQEHLDAMTGLSIQRWVVSSRLSFENGILYAPHPMYLATQPETKRRLWELLGG